MSLDVCLTLAGYGNKRVGSGIFVREDGELKEVTRAEWDKKAGGKEPVIVPVDEYAWDEEEVYWANITHNLGRMADEAGIYQYLWRPDELGIKTAAELIEPLRAGLIRLESNQVHFEQFNPSNGWGSYDALVSFTRRYLAACEEYPEATVTVSR